MKKHYLILLALLTLGLAAQAQKRTNNIQEKDGVSIGIKGGVNLPRMY